MVKFGNLTKEFKAGAQAFADGVKTKENPFSYGTKAWDDWHDGYQLCKAIDICIHYIQEADKRLETKPTDLNPNKGIPK